MKNALRLIHDPEIHLKTRIMATVGVSSKTYEVLSDMVKSGVTFFRFNGAHIENTPEPGHLSYDEASEIVENIRHLRSQFRQSIGMYFDLGGPKIRVLHVSSIQKYKNNGKEKKEKENWLQPMKGETVIIDAWNKQEDEKFEKKLEAFEYLFSWDEIPGNDSNRLIEYLVQNFGIDWVKTAEIKKIDEDKTIKISTEKNSLSLILNDKKNKVNLEIDDGGTNEFIAKVQNGKLNIYDKLDWADKEFVRKFFTKIGETEKNILMLGEEVEDFDNFKIGSPINLKDGWCRLKIKKKEKARLICEVDYVDSKFEFRPEQGANPYRHIYRRIITPKDEFDIKFGLQMGADIISLSFVCSPSDADDLRNKIMDLKKEIRNDAPFMANQSELYNRYISNEHKIPIFAKIETAYAVLPEEARKYAEEKNKPIPKDPLFEIAKRFDGLMVARGDLAVEVEKYKVPVLQRKIIKSAHLLNKPVIVATEMLENMRKGDTSTRAEIMDINTAVHEEADILMLSGETSNTKGKPADAVSEMWKTIKQAEEERLHQDMEKNFEILQIERETEISKMFKGQAKSLAISRLAQGNQVCVSARALGSDVIISSVKTGLAVQEISYFRPSQKILAITDDVLMGVHLLQHRGIYPIVLERPLKRTLDEFIDIVNEIHDEIGIPVPKNSKKTFRIPGLVRIHPAYPNGALTEVDIPNSIHEFTLPVKPQCVPETERKYILSEKSFQKLMATLKNDAVSWHYVKQHNYYFTDRKEVLFKSKIMLRIRFEELLEQHSSPIPNIIIGHHRRFEEVIEQHSSLQQSPHSNIEVFFTLKGKAEKSVTSKEEIRPEKEFNVTRELRDQFKISDDKEPTIDFNKLPTFYRHYIWNRHKKELETRYKGHEEIAYEQIAHMINYRFSFEMQNGFVLELDNAGAPPECQLEIELREDKHLGNLLDEYIHDKFCMLDIPIKRVDQSVMKDPKYPVKYVQALVMAKKLKKSDLKPMEEIKGSLNKRHADSCEKCRNIKDSLK